MSSRRVAVGAVDRVRSVPVARGSQASYVSRGASLVMQGGSRTVSSGRGVWWLNTGRPFFFSRTSPRSNTEQAHP